MSKITEIAATGAEAAAITHAATLYKALDDLVHAFDTVLCDALNRHKQTALLEARMRARAVLCLESSMITTQETQSIPDTRALIVCRACGHHVLTCTEPTCSVTHPLNYVDACGVCTVTGGIPVPESSEETS